MSRERARSYADRLPPLVPEAEADISHLADEMADLLYPGRRPRPFRMGVAFDAFDGRTARARSSWPGARAVYRETEEGGPRVHHAEFDCGRRPGPCATSSTSWASAPGTEVTVDGKKPPYARELWLPLFWIFVGGEALGLGFEEDLARSRASIRRLGVEWDKFFGGLEKKPPNDLQAKVEALIRRHANIEIRNNTERFRYQSLTASTTPCRELWTKRLRAKEEGKAFGVHGLKAEVLPPPPPPPPPAARAPRRAPRRATAGEVRVSEPERDAAAVQALYDAFLAARASGGRERRR